MDRHQGSGEDDTRDVVDLLIDQIEFCDVLIVNKCDMVNESDLQVLEGVIRKLQPKAKVVRASHGMIHPEEILNTNLFNFEVASQSAGWIQELQKGSHTPETEEYGISSFVYESKRPFHPERLAKWLGDFPEEVVRAKGTMWLATRNDVATSIAQAGPSIRIGPAGYWLAGLPEEERERLQEEEPELFEEWDDEWGDRSTKIVFIGIDIAVEAVISSLDRCLLTEEEMSGNWSEFQDSLPNIQMEEIHS